MRLDGGRQATEEHGQSSAAASDARSPRARADALEQFFCTDKGEPREA